MAHVIISFETDNAAFDEDYDGEIKKILSQAEEFLIGSGKRDTLRDTNGNFVGTCFISTRQRRG